MEVTLRPYQQAQLSFLKSRIKSPLPIGVESPTGSGKSVTILAFVDWYLHEHPAAKVVISTGFNHLVHQFKEDADAFGVPASILIGRGNVNCAVKIREDECDPADFPPFERNPSYKCVPAKCSGCKVPGCLFDAATAKAKQPGSLTITNHSSLLFYQHIFGDADLVVVDEAHTFSGFYEGWVNLDIQAVEVRAIQQAVEEMTQNRNPVASIFQRGLDQGNLHPSVMRTMVQMLKDQRHLKHPLHPVLVRKMEQFAQVRPSVDKFVETDQHGIHVHQFYSHYQMRFGQKTTFVLFTATLDRYTEQMFRLHKTRVYRERTYRSIDFSQSELVVAPYDFQQSLEWMVQHAVDQGYQNGLVLSTTLELVQQLLDQKQVGPFDLVGTIAELEEHKDQGKPCVLVGSRALFQGVDIYDLDFVMLNKIPFPRYDQCFKQQSQYLQQVTKLDPWKYFTIPKVANDMIQTTGRLWRRPGDHGTVLISDERLHREGKFHWMQKLITEVRPGIRVVELPMERKPKKQ